MLRITKNALYPLLIFGVIILFTGCIGTSDDTPLHPTASTPVSTSLTTSVSQAQDNPYVCNPQKTISPSQFAGFVPEISGFSFNKNLLPKNTLPSLNSGVMVLYIGEGTSSGKMLGVIINDYGCNGLPKGNTSSWEQLYENYKSKDIAGFPTALQDVPDDNRMLQTVNIHDRILVVFSSIGKENRLHEIQKLNDVFDFKGLATLI